MEFQRSNGRAMADAVLVRDFTELGVARRVFGDGLRELQVYTLYPQQYLELTHAGIHSNLFSQHITASESYDIYRRAFQDITSIVDSFPMVEGTLPVNLGRYFKVYYWEFLTEVYALDLALKRILEGGNGVKFSYLRPRYVALASHADLVSAGFVSGRMLDALSRQQPAIVQPLASDSFGPIPSLTPGYEARRLLRSMKSIARSALLYGRVLAGRPAQPVSGEARAIAFGNSYDALIVIPDALRLADETGRKPLWMTEWVDKDTTRSGLVYKDEYEQLERFSIIRYLARHPVPPLTGAEARQADKLFTEMMKGLDQIEVVGRYGLTKTMAELRHEFCQALWRTRAMDSVLAPFAGSTLVVTNYNGFDERAIEQLAPLHQIGVFARPHGWISNIEGFEYQARCHLLSGELWRDLFKTFYGEGTTIALSPDPSLVKVANEWLDKSADEQRMFVTQKRVALSIEARHVILLMTTAARARILNEFDYSSLRRLWMHVFDYLKTRPDVHVLIKSHKNNFDWWVASQAAQHGVTNLTILDGRLEDAVMLADLVVDLGKPGTATLVALLFRRPTLLYRGLYKYVRQLGDLAYSVGASSVVDGPEQLVVELEGLRGKGETYLIDLKSRNCHLLNHLVKI